MKTCDIFLKYGNEESSSENLLKLDPFVSKHACYINIKLNV